VRLTKIVILLTSAGLYGGIIAQGLSEPYAVLCQTCHNSKTSRGECEHIAAARVLFELAAESICLRLSRCSLLGREPTLPLFI
jgi:hypothetical protein